MTKTISLALTLGAMTFAGCSDEADIGTDIDPVTCLASPTGEVHGGVSSGQYHHDFGAVTTQMFPNPDTGGAMVQLNDNELFLRIDFLCGRAERESYDVVGLTANQQLACPYQVTGSIVGQIEYLPATDGVVIVDETANCLAGRFRVDLGESGELTGWFSTPWQ